MIRRIWRGTWDVHAISSQEVEAAAHTFTDCDLLAPVDQTELVNAPFWLLVTCPQCLSASGEKEDDYDEEVES